MIWDRTLCNVYNLGSVVLSAKMVKFSNFEVYVHMDLYILYRNISVL